MKLIRLAGFLSALPLAVAAGAAAKPSDSASDYGKLPLAFEPNMGQTDPDVLFWTRSRGTAVFLTGSETVMVLRNGEQAVVRMKLVGARKPLHAAGMEKLPGVSNYFVGNDPQKWRTDIPHYGRVSLEGVYPGVDLVYRSDQGRLEYDLVLAPGVKPEVIRIAYEGAQSVNVDGNGDLLLETKLGILRQQRPMVYQEVKGRRVEVAGGYRLQGRTAGFTVARYDATRPLVIDPVMLDYSTFLGGSGNDYGQGIAVDASGSAYVTGVTNSPNFPHVSAYQGTNQGSWDVFISKLTPSGSALVYSTYLGGSGEESGNSIALDGANSAYVVGWTSSSDFPTQSPFQSTLKGSYSAFVTKLAPAGNALVYSTYLGGGTSDEGAGIAVDSAGSAYVAGDTLSSDFPTQTPYQARLMGNRNVFVTKLAPDGKTLSYSTYLGGSGEEYGTGIALDTAGSAYVTGWTTSGNFPTRSPYQGSLKSTHDAFVTKLSPDGKTLSYSTYLGGSGDDFGNAIAVDAAGSAYVTGNTQSHDFPTQAPYQASLNGTQDVFVTKLAPAGNALIYSTYLGGSDYDSRGDTNPDSGSGIAVDAAGSAYVTGQTGSPDFPTKSAFQDCHGCPGSDAFVAKFAPAGNALIYSTFLGGYTYNVGGAIAVDAAGQAYVTGDTDTTSYPTQVPYEMFQGGYCDAYITKLALPATVATTPPGLAVTVDGVSLTSPQAFDWAAGSSHTISVPSPQTLAGTQYVFSNWSDGGAQAHAVSTHNPPVVYLATFMVGLPQWSIAKTHSGSFTQGQNGAAYTIRVTNLGTVATSGAVTVTDNAPAGLTLVSMTGQDWACPPGGNTCTRSDALNPGANFPDITATVNVSASAAASLTNQASVSGGGAASSASASDSTAITPASAGGTPLAVSVSPAAGSWASESYTFAFSDSAGWQSIHVADILINSFVDGRNACYVAVVPAQSAVYLVDDAGDAGGPYQGMVLPGSGTVENSQCSIAAAGSSIAGSGNTLTVMLAITFKAAFAGNKVMYLAARESGGANSGWQALGTCGVPGSTPTGPAVGGVTPARSSGTGGGSFVFTFTDTNGWQDLGVVNVLINDALNGNGACYLAYSRAYNTLYLVNDAGNGLLPGLTLNGSGTLGNSQCTVTGAGSSASGSGNTLTLTLNMSFPPSFAGNRVIYMAARSNGDLLNSGWQAVGSRTVQ